MRNVLYNNNRPLEIKKSEFTAVNQIRVSPDQFGKVSVSNFPIKTSLSNNK